MDAGVCREQARGVLPKIYMQNTTVLVISTTLKFIELRTHEGAQWEIVELLVLVWI